MDQMSCYSMTLIRDTSIQWHALYSPGYAMKLCCHCKFLPSCGVGSACSEHEIFQCVVQGLLSLTLNRVGTLPLL